MNIFKDKVYEEMDWLEKACVPTVCELNDVLSIMPNCIYLTYEDMVKYGLRYGPSSIEVRDILGNKNFDGKEEYAKLRYHYRDKINKCFNLVVEGDLVLNLEHETLTGGEIKLVKIKELFNDKEIDSLIGKEGLSDNIYNLRHRDVCKDRLNEMLELLGLYEARRNRSTKQKVYALVERMKEIMNSNEWDIRDVNLSNRVSLWVKKYLVDGNLAAYTNFCKLKVMTHDEQPIYSVEGEEEV